MGMHRLGNQIVVQHQEVQAGSEETADRVDGRLNNGFTHHVETGVEEDRNPAQLLELLVQLVVARVDVPST